MKGNYLIGLVATLAMTLSGALFAHGPGHFSGSCEGVPGSQKQAGYVEFEDICYRVDFFCSVGLDNLLPGFTTHALDVWYDDGGLEYQLGVKLGEIECVSMGLNPVPGATDKMSYSCVFEGREEASFLIHQVNSVHCPENGD